MTYDEFNLILDARDLCRMHHEEINRASLRGVSVMIAYEVAQAAELKDIMESLNADEAEVFADAYREAEKQYGRHR